MSDHRGSRRRITDPPAPSRCDLPQRPRLSIHLERIRRFLHHQWRPPLHGTPRHLPLNRLIARRLESDKSASISRLREVIRGRRPNQSSIGRIMLRQRRRRIILRHLQKRTHPHPPMERSHRGPSTHFPVDRRLLQPPATTLHPQLLDTTRIRTRIQKTNRSGGLNRCQ